MPGFGAGLREETVREVELLASGKGGCGPCGGGCCEGAAGVKAEEAEGMEALGAAGREDGLTALKLDDPPNGRAVLL